MEHSANTQNEAQHQVSLKDIILQIIDWLKYFISQWKTIVPVGLLGAGLGFWYALSVEKKYESEITFVLENNSGGQLAGYAGIASQMGFDLGSQAGTGIFSDDNILEFLKSRLLIERTLLSPMPGSTKPGYSLADEYTRINKFREKWAEKPELRDIKFPSILDRKKFTLSQDSLLNEFRKKIVKEELVVSKPDKKLSFISVKCVSPDELYSKRFTEVLVREATDFYVATKIKRSQTNVDKLQAKADSILSLLNAKTYSVAETRDVNMNPVRNIAQVKEELGMRDKLVLQTMYGEVVKHLEMSRMSMNQETPIIQIIDSPILPLKILKFGKLKGMIIGGLIAGFLCIGILILRRIYLNVMK